MFDESLRTRLIEAREAAIAALLSERNPSRHWTGELSSSALSTATAITALTLVARRDPVVAQRARECIDRGYAWLIQHQNPDGGWGDTIHSISNISTTTLVWAALGLLDRDPSGAAEAVAAAERWLTHAAGSIEPDQLVRAIENCYGDDRTFSIPILTLCALSGRLGPAPEAWDRVRQLPFEIAALPQRWFRTLRLPVVSYALPALIAIGQVRHGLRPTRNPVLRRVRDHCRACTLEKLSQLQPSNGGFLEATPLTSFVTMSLAALDLTAHPVVQRGIAFITNSARFDGSWPIDTNLATWLTTLSVNALVPNDASESASYLDEPERNHLRDWLLRQQFRLEHPYTLAAPGGWAWTDLPGGVPDADDTAGAMIALHRLAPDDPVARDAAQRGVDWLLALQNRDSGIPTFCRGWGRLPFDRSSPDLTAHAIRAWGAWRDSLPGFVQQKIDDAVERALLFLRKTQRSDGSWVPLWFGHQEHPAHENPLYGTARVVLALGELEPASAERMSDALTRALHWLIESQKPDGGWSGASCGTSSMEETGLAVEALCMVLSRNKTEDAKGGEVRKAIERGAMWLAQAIETKQWSTPKPIGLYFAKLWYHERLYPLIFAVSALIRVERSFPHFEMNRP